MSRARFDDSTEGEIVVGSDLTTDHQVRTPKGWRRVSKIHGITGFEVEGSDGVNPFHVGYVARLVEAPSVRADLIEKIILETRDHRLQTIDRVGDTFEEFAKAAAKRINEAL